MQNKSVQPHSIPEQPAVNDDQIWASILEELFKNPFDKQRLVQRLNAAGPEFKQNFPAYIQQKNILVEVFINGTLHALEFLKDKGVHFAGRVDEDGNTLWHVAAKLPNSKMALRRAEMLLRFKVSAIEKNKQGQTALHLAICHNPEMAALLIEQFIDMSLPDQQGNPVHIFHLPDAQGQTPLSLAVNRNSRLTSEMRMILSRASTEAKPEALLLAKKIKLAIQRRQLNKANTLFSELKQIDESNCLLPELAIFTINSYGPEDFQPFSAKTLFLIHQFCEETIQQDNITINVLSYPCDGIIPLDYAKSKNENVYKCLKENSENGIPRLAPYNQSDYLQQLWKQYEEQKPIVEPIAAVASSASSSSTQETQSSAPVDNNLTQMQQLMVSQEVLPPAQDSVMGRPRTFLQRFQALSIKDFIAPHDASPVPEQFAQDDEKFIFYVLTSSSRHLFYNALSYFRLNKSLLYVERAMQPQNMQQHLDEICDYIGLKIASKQLKENFILTLQFIGANKTDMLRVLEEAKLPMPDDEWFLQQPANASISYLLNRYLSHAALSNPDEITFLAQLGIAIRYNCCAWLDQQIKKNQCWKVLQEHPDHLEKIEALFFLPLVVKNATTPIVVFKALNPTIQTEILTHFFLKQVLNVALQAGCEDVFRFFWEKWPAHEPKPDLLTPMKGKGILGENQAFCFLFSQLDSVVQQAFIRELNWPDLVIQGAATFLFFWRFLDPIQRQKISRNFSEPSPMCYSMRLNSLEIMAAMWDCLTERERSLFFPSVLSDFPCIYTNDEDEILQAKKYLYITAPESLQKEMLTTHRGSLKHETLFHNACQRGYLKIARWIWRQAEALRPQLVENNLTTILVLIDSKNEVNKNQLGREILRDMVQTHPAELLQIVKNSLLEKGQIDSYKLSNLVDIFYQIILIGNSQANNWLFQLWYALPAQARKDLKLKMDEQFDEVRIISDWFKQIPAQSDLPKLPKLASGIARSSDEPAVAIPNFSPQPIAAIPTSATLSHPYRTFSYFTLFASAVPAAIVITGAVQLLQPTFLLAAFNPPMAMVIATLVAATVLTALLLMASIKLYRYAKETTGESKQLKTPNEHDSSQTTKLLSPMMQ